MPRRVCIILHSALILQVLVSEVLPNNGYSAVFSRDWRNFCVVGTPDFSYSTTNPTIGECAYRCSTTNGCTVYNYFEDSSVCQLFTCPSDSTSTFDFVNYCKAYMDDKYKLGRYTLTDGSGFILYQRRVDMSVVFDQLWASYKNGFGNICGNYWLGNEPVRQMTANKYCTLRFEMNTITVVQTYVAVYSSFYIDAETNKYTIHVSGFSGNATYDAFGKHTGCAFQAKDMMTTTCPTICRAGWWYTNCHAANMNSNLGFGWLNLPNGPYINYSQMWVKC